MSNGSGKGGSGRGNNRRRSFRQRDNNAWQGDDPSREKRFPQQDGRPHTRQMDNQKAAGRRQPEEDHGRHHRGGGSRRGGEHRRSEKAAYFERPKWTPPKLNKDPLPVPDCPYCGKPIRDLASAIADKDSGAPIHFDCVAAKIAEGERLEKDDVITYIGGGRFGIVNFDRSQAAKRTSADFKIKKIIEWENKDKREEWRSLVCEHYSVI